MREQTGLGLKEAKDLVDSQVGGNVGGAARSWSGMLPASAAAALEHGNKIDAIRLLREETGLDLKEAKAFIDAHSQRILADRNILSPGEVPRLGSGLLWLAASAIVIGNRGVLRTAAGHLMRTRVVSLDVSEDLRRRAVIRSPQAR